MFERHMRIEGKKLVDNSRKEHSEVETNLSELNGMSIEDKSLSTHLGNALKVTDDERLGRTRS
jgi:hypothetical protein